VRRSVIHRAKCATEPAVHAGQYERHTGDAARASIQHGTVRVTLIELQPYPFGSLPAIRPEQYRATFTASAS
jgi:hypothetical protein